MTIKRHDRRAMEEIRQMSAKVGVFANADGSAMFRFGKTVAIAAVYGPRKLHPQYMQNPSKGILRVNYDLLSFSVSDRKRPGPSRRSKEISKVTEWALSPVLDLKEFPSTVVDVEISILQADASTRVAGINAAAMALAQAGIPMKNMVSAIAIGKIDKELIVDVDKEEEDFDEGEGATDFPMAKISNKNEFTLMQLDGKIQPELLIKAVEMATESCNKVYEVQKKALKESICGGNE